MFIGGKQWLYFMYLETVAEVEKLFFGTQVALFVFSAREHCVKFRKSGFREVKDPSAMPSELVPPKEPRFGIVLPENEKDSQQFHSLPQVSASL